MHASPRLVLPATLLAALAPSGTGQCQVVKITAGDPDPSDELGAALSFDGPIAAVGAPGDDGAGDSSGAVYVYQLDGTGATRLQKLHASGYPFSQQLGRTVLVSGQTILAESVTPTGSVFVFEEQGGSWSEVQEIKASDQMGADQFGVSIARHGDWLLVGAWLDDAVAFDAGSAYFFTEVGGSWVEQQKITAGDGTFGDVFGVSVALWGDWAIVGAREDDPGGVHSGSVYAFRNQGGTWVETQKLVASDAAPRQLFGHAVALEAGRAVITAWPDDPSGVHPGAAYVFELSNGVWNEVQKVVAFDATDATRLGLSVALDGDRFAVGADGDASQGPETGAVYVFELQGGTWVQTSKVLSSDAGGGDRLGHAVDLSSTFVLAGAPYHDVPAGDGGAAYLFNLRFDACGEPGRALCFGDGTGTPCPCGNEARVQGRGCRHSGGGGMRISGSGTVSLFADDLRLTAEDCPPGNSGLFYVGTQLLGSGLPFFSGLQCAGGDARRFAPLFQVTGTATDTGFVAQDPSGSYFLPGATYRFQYWTRDVSPLDPCATGAAMSPAYEVTMSP